MIAEKIKLGKTSMMVSKLGFGGIPIQRVSEDEAIAVVRRCLELDINFIDTANGYTNSEERIGKAISGRCGGLIIATKSTSRKRGEIESHLELSLNNLGVESIDLYQFHNVSDSDSLNEILAPNGPMTAVKEAKRAGIVKHIGVTSHSMDIAKELVISGHFETIMFPFNFITCEAAEELLPLAREHDVGFIAMKPLAGGMINNIALALKYLLQFPDVVILVGIEKVKEIDEINEFIKRSWRITEAEHEEIQHLREELGTRFCRRCDYCQPCAEGINISAVLQTKSFFKRLPPQRFFSGWIADALEKAVNCTKCGDCEERCPYGLPIRDMVEECSNLYQEEKRKYLALREIS